MGLRAWPLSYPFPGAAVRVTPPIETFAHLPKAWNIDGTMGASSNFLTSNNSFFQSAGVAVGDPVSICRTAVGVPYSTTVAVVATEHLIVLVDPCGIAGIDAGVFKVGLGPVHDLDSLGLIILARGLSNYSIKWGDGWTDAVFADFNTGHVGEVYCI